MQNMPPIELAININKIISKNRGKLKAYQDKHGKVNFNLLVGMLLGSICSFVEQPMVNMVLKTFMPVFKTDTELNDYVSLMMELNNYLVFTLDTNPESIYLLDDDEWVTVADADFNSLFALWYAFFGIMKVEFEDNRDKIEELSVNPIVNEALDGYNVMHNIMTSFAVSIEDISIMHEQFPLYAQKFNELRKLMHLKTTTAKLTLH